MMLLIINIYMYIYIIYVVAQDYVYHSIHFYTYILYIYIIYIYIGPQDYVYIMYPGRAGRITNVCI